MSEGARWAPVPGLLPIAERVETVEGVERLWVSVAPGGRAAYWAIVHLVDGVLVDSGPSRARRAVGRFVARRPLSAVLTTHGHEDHVGNHEALPRDVPVHAPAATLPLLESGPPPIPFYRRLTWGAHGASPGARGFEAGETVETPKRRFLVVATPGHSDDHVSFLDEDAGAIFTGDAFLGRSRIARLEEDLHAQVETWRRLADLDPSLLFPGHGPVVRRPRARLLDQVGHYESLARRCHALADRGWAPRRIRRELLGREPFLRWFSRGEFSAENLVVNLLRRRV